MYLRNIAVGLTALVLLSSGANARSLPDLYSKQQKQASFDNCADLFPAATPINTATVPATMRPLALCSDHFAVLYSQASKTPLVVVERLNAAQLKDAKGEERTNQFYADPRIPKGGRAELSDYRSQHPAVDRGHQAPAADAPNANAMAQSFALSNMVPQDPTNNRKIWSKVEADVRKFAVRAGGDVYVFTGPLFDPGHSTIGANQVWVPTRLFKLVYDASSKRAWAYVLPNAETRIQKPMDYDTFVKSTGLKLLGNLPVSGSVGRT
ncbi:DNA/RNA non-specific endonuclease [Pseudomonas sp. PDM05]|uniref:DNA/RNA non-specific endonuclease n=1 Tax=Pseudomonas sp. PDM05 TaxID=2769301 RepID=UPI0017800B88|nr:DNA/RNA non-specific endonuclease [Pseudomonas sp. PDM05]MBD9456630.1 DNA/RNA non-specific endonuclease [Pseudomonas sp. PDM05]